MRMRALMPAAALIASLSGASAFAEPVVVSCGAGHRAIVHDTFVRGERVTNVSCAPTYRAARYYRRPHRSWGKSALVIGGAPAPGRGGRGPPARREGARGGGGPRGGRGRRFSGARRTRPD